MRLFGSGRQSARSRCRQYDWRAREARYNRFRQFKTDIDGLGIHFIHARSEHEGAKPLLITHGWPGSVVEFDKVIEPAVRRVAGSREGGLPRSSEEVLRLARKMAHGTSREGTPLAIIGATSKAAEMTVEEIMAANGIADANQLVVGQELAIPPPSQGG